MKILIIYASAGAGHKKAAEAIYKAACGSQLAASSQIVLIDALDYTNKFFKWLYSKKYLTLVNYLPNIWGFFYYLFDTRIVYKLLWLVRRIINAINCRCLEGFLCEQKPDVVISTHFMANEIISWMKKQGKLNCRLFCAVTDYRLHSFWVVPEVDRYFVAMDQTRKDLLWWGVLESKIHITGIPIDPKFSHFLDKFEMRAKLGMDRDLFTALLIGGGFGVGPVEELVKKIGTLPIDVQLLVVCGYNKVLYEDVNKVISGSDIKAKVYGFVDNIHQLMSASDVLVTKSGGMTSAEALAKGLPAIFVKPIPGQERRNSKVLEASQAAFIAKDVDEVKEKIKELFQNRDLLGQMAASIRKIARPNSARDIVDLVRRECTQI